MKRYSSIFTLVFFIIITFLFSFIPRLALAAGQWSDTGSTIITHWIPSMTTMQDGKVILVSGGGDIYTTEIYDPASGQWTQTGNVNVPRDQFNPVLLNNGKILIAGGTSGGSPVNSAELYDPTTGQWTFTGSLNETRTAAIFVKLLNGNVLAIGGRGPISSELYDPATGQWTMAANLNVPRAGSEREATLLHDGRVLVAGGAFTETNTTEIYDPAANTWTLTGNLIVPRESANLITLANGNVLLFNGTTSTNYLTDAELYNPTTGIWIAAPSLTYARSAPAKVTLSDGRILVAGGDDAGIAVKQTEIYDPVANTWTVDASSNHGHQAGNMVLLTTSKALLVGGFDNSSQTTSSELYTPPTANPSTTVTFDDIAPIAPLNGVYAGINWETGMWDVDATVASDATHSISFHTAAVTNSTFAFSTPSALLSVDLESNSNQTALITLSCFGNNPVSATVSAEQHTTLTTNWTTPCTTVTVTSSNAWHTNLDNLVYSSVQNPGVTPNPTPTPPPGPTGGYTTQGAQLDTGDSGYMNGSKFITNSTGGAATSMSVFVGNVDTGSHNQYQMAIYTDNNGKPGTLVAKTASGILSQLSWNTLPITATFSANTTYWLMYNTNATANTNYDNNMYFDQGAKGIAAYAKHMFNSWPTTFPTATLNTTQFSLYVSY